MDGRAKSKNAKINLGANKLNARLLLFRKTVNNIILKTRERTWGWSPILPAILGVAFRQFETHNPGRDRAYPYPCFAHIKGIRLCVFHS